MRQLLSVAMAGVVAIGLAGCSSGTGRGASGISCENCNYGYVPGEEGRGTPLMVHQRRQDARLPKEAARVPGVRCQGGSEENPT
jgi:hypothetical protein